MREVKSMPRRFLPLTLLLALLVGCSRTPPALPKVLVAPKKVDDTPRHQGLSAAERDEFYHLTMGSELVPLGWLRALESQATGKPFLENVERFGLLPDPASADGLPVGLTAAVSKDARFPVKMVGLNCAVCHTGEMTYQGKTIRLEGAPSLFDAEAFTTDLIISLVATMKTPNKMLAFLKRQLDDQIAAERPAAHRFFSQWSSFETLRSAGELEKKLADRCENLVENERQRLSSALESGLAFDKDQARLSDLVGKIEHGAWADLAALEPGAQGPLAHLQTKAERESVFKQLFEHLTTNLRLLKARIDFAKKAVAEAKLKLANTHGGPGRVDDFGAARNLLFDLKDAQAMDAPCSIPHLWGTRRLKWTNWDGSTQSSLERSLATALAGGAVFDPKTYRSTVNVRNLGRLEALAKKIAAPVWPEDLFGKIDRQKAERGAKLFKEHCAKCHVDPNRPRDLAADKDWPPDLLIDLTEIGTDPNRVRNYSRPLGDRSFGAAVQTETARYLEQACKDEQISAAELNTYRDGHANVWRTTSNYAARPLVAVWATAPYLHNGSVPTIHDLLLPADQRPKTFPLGQREYDPATLGYVTNVEKTIFLFDTSKPGNSNAGHEYGTKLTDVERQELIEHLKAN
jgi:hypothetical protein